MSSRIKILKELLNEDRVFKDVKNYNYSPKNYDEFEKILGEKSLNRNPNLNDIDVSNLEAIGGFSHFDFFKTNNFFVDEWNVSNVKDFSHCFYDCNFFNCNLDKWDVSNAINTDGFFDYALHFNQEVNHFDISNSENVRDFFAYCHDFNKELYNFKFHRKANNFVDFFRKCLNFNQDISMWDVSNVEFFSKMFFYAIRFKQDLSGWDTSSAIAWLNVFFATPMVKHPELMPEKFRRDYLK